MLYFDIDNFLTIEFYDEELDNISKKIFNLLDNRGSRIEKGPLGFCEVIGKNGEYDKKTQEDIHKILRAEIFFQERVFLLPLLSELSQSASFYNHTSYIHEEIDNFCYYLNRSLKSKNALVLSRLLEIIVDGDYKGKEIYE